MGLLDTRPPAAKFPTLGTRVGGEVTADATEVQCRNFDTGDLEFWDDGNPRMQLVIEVKTTQRDPASSDDDGTRTIYAKGAMLAAIRDACRKARSKAIRVGDELWITYIRDEPLPKGKRGFPKKIYEAQYTKGGDVNLTLRGGTSDGKTSQHEPPF